MSLEVFRLALTSPEGLDAEFFFVRREDAEATLRAIEDVPWQQTDGARRVRYVRVGDIETWQAEAPWARWRLDIIVPTDQPLEATYIALEVEVGSQPNE